MTEEMKYWATRGKRSVGPFPTRSEALDAFEKAYPFKGAEYMRRAKSNEIMSGYGEFGPHFDVRWTAPIK